MENNELMSSIRNHSLIDDLNFFVVIWKCQIKISPQINRKPTSVLFAVELNKHHYPEYRNSQKTDLAD